MFMYSTSVCVVYNSLCVCIATVSEAREDPKVLQYIQAGMARANEASISRAAKMQVSNHCQPTLYSHFLSFLGIQGL